MMEKKKERKRQMGRCGDVPVCAVLSGRRVLWKRRSAECGSWFCHVKKEIFNVDDVDKGILILIGDLLRSFIDAYGLLLRSVRRMLHRR